MALRGPERRQTERRRREWTQSLGPATLCRLDLSTLLLDAGADVECLLKKDTNAFLVAKGESIIHWASIANVEGEDRAEMIRLLLSRGANPLQRDAGPENSPLINCCTVGHVAGIEAILEAAPHAIDQGNKFGTMALTLAAMYGRLDALKWCIARYPEHFAEASTGFTIGWLGFACVSFGDLDIIRTLLDLGHNPSYYDPKNVTTKALADVFTIRKLMMRLSSRPSKVLETFAVGIGTPLHVASYLGNLGAVELLLERKADIASINHQLKMTPLHAAALAGHREVCVRLIEARPPSHATTASAPPPRARGGADILRSPRFSRPTCPSLPCSRGCCSE